MGNLSKVIREERRGRDFMAAAVILLLLVLVLVWFWCEGTKSRGNRLGNNIQTVKP